MYFESLYVAKTTVSLSIKNRVFLPAKVKAEKNEQLVIVDYKTHAEIYSLEFYINKLNKMVENNKASVDFFANSFIVTVDSEHRILLPTTLTENYDFKDGVIFIGAAYYLLMFDKQKLADYYLNKSIDEGINQRLKKSQKCGLA